MENVSHTLAGFVLARGGLEKTTPLAATALVVGANLPDVDLAWSSFKSALVYFHYHRGWTHSLPGAAVLTVLLWAVLLGVDRWVPAQRSGSGARARPLPLLAAAAMGVGSHLLMDAANSYGVRPLLPWSDRWMYGDAHRLQRFHECVRDLDGEIFLDLEPAREHVDDPRHFGKADHFPVWNVSNVCAADEGKQMVLAQRIELDVFD